MRIKRIIPLGSLVFLSWFVLFSCAEKADENKPISKIKTEVEKMDTSQLKSMAKKYKDAILAKRKDVEKIAAELKEIPITEMLSEKAKLLKADMERLNKSAAAMMDRFQIYFQKLKEKGGDISGMEL